MDKRKMIIGIKKHLEGVPTSYDVESLKELCKRASCSFASDEDMFNWVKMLAYLFDEETFYRDLSEFDIPKRLDVLIGYISNCDQDRFPEWIEEVVFEEIEYLRERDELFYKLIENLNERDARRLILDMKDDSEFDFIIDFKNRTKTRKEVKEDER